MYSNVLKEIPDYLHGILIDNVMSLNKDQEEANIAEHLFSGIDRIPLIDKYAAYQILSNCYGLISTDIEIIQTEKFDATRIVEPHLVIKKKGDKEEEVQDGWQGHILPFELVQKTMLRKEYNSLCEEKDSLEKKVSEIEDIKQMFNEEDLQDDFYDSEKQTFIAKGVSARVKTIKKELKGAMPKEDSFEETLLNYDKACEEVKVLKKSIKSLDDKIVKETMALIPTLSDEQVKALLHKKWITPLCEKLGSLPDNIIDELSSSLEKLHKKYGRSLMEIEKDKREVESGLSALLNNLTGNENDMEAFRQLKAIIGGQGDE